MDLNKPSAPHKHLEQLVGKWDLAITYYKILGGKPDITGEGTFEAKMTYDGRFLEATGKTQIGALPETEERQVWGYDNVGKKYVSARWGDFETQVRLFTGTSDADGKTLTTEHEGAALGPEGKGKFKEILRIESANRMLIEGYAVGQSKDFKIFQIVATRRTP